MIYGRLSNERATNTIYEGDVFAEGCDVSPQTDMRPFVVFQNLWDSINGKDKSKNWDANPWVWVIEFERVEQ